MIHYLFGTSGQHQSGFASDTVTSVRLTSTQNFVDARPLRAREVTAVLDCCPALTSFVLSFDAKEEPGEEPGWFASSSVHHFREKVAERHRAKITHESVLPRLRGMCSVRYLGPCVSDDYKEFSCAENVCYNATTS